MEWKSNYCSGFMCKNSPKHFIKWCTRLQSKDVNQVYFILTWDLKQWNTFSLVPSMCLSTPFSIYTNICLANKRFKNLYFIICIDNFNVGINREAEVVLGWERNWFKHIFVRTKVFVLIILHFFKLMTNEISVLALEVKIFCLKIVSHEYALSFHLLLVNDQKITKNSKTFIDAKEEIFNTIKSYIFILIRLFLEVIIQEMPNWIDFLCVYQYRVVINIKATFLNNVINNLGVLVRISFE